MLLFWYVIAKVAETADVALWNATGGLVAGHMIKHVAAAIGGFAVAAALRRASVTDHVATARDPGPAGRRPASGSR